MEIADVAVIGGGPAGLFCAIHAAGPKTRVIVLEKNKTPGMKLKISGTGQCNLTHEGRPGDFLTHYGSRGNFLKPALFGCTSSDVQQFFIDRDVPLEITEAGKVFPASRKSQDILFALLREAEKNCVEIFTEEPVISVQKCKTSFLVTTKSHTFEVRFVVLATGGMSYPKTGSTGDGYRLAKALGHTITPVYPALSPVTIRNFPFAALSGLSFSPLHYSVWRQGKKVMDCCGDVLITHTGLSGPGILDHSRDIRPDDRLLINFTRNTSRENAEKQFLLSVKDNPKRTIKTLLAGFLLPDRLVPAILDQSGIPHDLTGAHITAEQRKTLLGRLTGFPLDVATVGDFSCAMATSGGVTLDEVDKKTLESKIVPGLYFAGEVLDIDGDTGGYNIQAAFSTGFLAAQAIRKKTDAG